MSQSKRSCLSAYRDFNLTEALGNISAQICCEVNKSLAERNFPALPAELQETLKGQICDITQENNPIRTLVGKEKILRNIRVPINSTGDIAKKLSYSFCPVYQYKYLPNIKKHLREKQNR